MKVLDNGLVRVNTQYLVAPSDIQINETAKNGPLPESYVQEQTVTKQRETREPPALNTNKSLTVNDAIDALSNSNKWAGTDIFICSPDGNCSDENSAFLSFINYLEGNYCSYRDGSYR